jgi:hypothetical protein
VTRRRRPGRPAQPDAARRPGPCRAASRARRHGCAELSSRRPGWLASRRRGHPCRGRSCRFRNHRAAGLRHLRNLRRARRPVPVRRSWSRRSCRLGRGGPGRRPPGAMRLGTGHPCYRSGRLPGRCPGRAASGCRHCRRAGSPVRLTVRRRQARASRRRTMSCRTGGRPGRRRLARPQAGHRGRGQLAAARDRALRRPKPARRRACRPPAVRTGPQLTAGRCPAVPDRVRRGRDAARYPSHHRGGLAARRGPAQPIPAVRRGPHPRHRPTSSRAAVPVPHAIRRGRHPGRGHPTSGCPPRGARPRSGRRRHRSSGARQLACVRNFRGQHRGHRADARQPGSRRTGCHHVGGHSDAVRHPRDGPHSPPSGILSTEVIKQGRRAWTCQNTLRATTLR